MNGLSGLQGLPGLSYRSPTAWVTSGAVLDLNFKDGLYYAAGPRSITSIPGISFGANAPNLSAGGLLVEDSLDDVRIDLGLSGGVWTNLGDLNPADGFTVLVEAIVPAISPANYLWAINGPNTYNDIVGQYYNADFGGGTAYAILEANNVPEPPTLSMGSLSLTPGSRVRAAYTLSASRRRFAVNGTLSAEDTSNTLPTNLQTLHVGARRSDLNHWSDLISRLIIIPGVYTDAQLQAWSGQ